MFVKTGTYNGEDSVAFILSKNEALVLRTILGQVPCIPADNPDYPQPETKEIIEPFVTSLFTYLDTLEIDWPLREEWCLTMEWMRLKRKK